MDEKNTLEVTIPLTAVDDFQMTMLEQGTIPGVFPFEYRENALHVNTSGYTTLKDYLSRHTLTVKVFKNIIDNFLSIMEDSILHYLDWCNFCIDGDLIYIALDESEIRMIHKPVGISQDSDCPIRAFLFQVLMPYAKFTRDEDWSFLLQGMTVVNSLQHQVNRLDVLYDAFQLRAGIMENSRNVAEKTNHNVKMPSENHLASTLKKRPWDNLLHRCKSKVSKVQNDVKSDQVSDILQETVVIKKTDQIGRLLPVTSGYPTISIVGKNMIIGRNRKSSDIALSASDIGKIHAEIIIESGQIFLRDLNSLNGTYHNNRKLEPYELCQISHGDAIRFSEIQYRVEVS
ncbi:MAG: FHA domain-containing protein [Clostridia bacterium]|nr:FHA domain-containing protein [Clostridia bacterium]